MSAPTDLTTTGRWSEPERLERLRRFDCALAEAGFPNSIDRYFGRLTNLDVPPDVLCRAHNLACGEAYTVDELLRMAFETAPGWERYARRHGVAIDQPGETLWT